MRVKEKVREGNREEMKRKKSNMFECTYDLRKRIKWKILGTKITS